MNQQQFEVQLLAEINRLNSELVPYGRVILPIWMVNQDIAHIRRLVASLSAAQNDSDRRNVLEIIDIFISRYSFSPLNRAFQCHRANEVPGINAYSHHLEMATGHYYRRDYLSALKVMVPLIEGIILHLMKAPQTQHVSNVQLISFLKNQQLTARSIQPDSRLPARFASFRDLLCDFLSTRFYEKVANAQTKGQFDFSMLNRHYILHQLGQTPFDTLHDSQTMFQLFDLLLETVSCQTGISSSYCWIPEHQEILDRESYYWSIILKDYFRLDTEGQAWDLLSLHSSYNKPSSDTNWLALWGHPMDDKEAMVLAEAITKVSQRTLASIGMSVALIDERKKGKLAMALELRSFIKEANDEKIAKLAYENWVRRGKGNGRDEKDWFDAEKSLHLTPRLARF